MTLAVPEPRRGETLLDGGGALQPAWAPVLAYSSARRRKAAIWPRVTLAVGQYVGAVQPVVMPARRMRLMLASWVVPSSSVK
jgi:hypothetical protein